MPGVIKTQHPGVILKAGGNAGRIQDGACVVELHVASVGYYTIGLRTGECFQGIKKLPMEWHPFIKSLFPVTDFPVYHRKQSCLQ